MFSGCKQKERFCFRKKKILKEIKQSQLVLVALSPTENYELFPAYHCYVLCIIDTTQSDKFDVMTTGIQNCGAGAVNKEAAPAPALTCI